MSDAISSLSPNSLLVPADLLDDRPSPPQKSDSKLPLLPNSDNLSLASDLADVVHAAAELANLRFSKVMAVRSEVHSTLTLPEFLEIFDVTWSFVLECEVICRRMIVGLRGVMVGQAKGFLQTFHQKRITEGARMVENEQWVVAEVSGEVQEVVDLVLKSAVTNPPAFLLGARVKVQSNGNVPAIEEAGDAAKKLAKQVDIDGTGYFAVAAGLHALEVLGEYLKVVMNCPLLTTDAMSKVIEYMKVRSCSCVRSGQLMLLRQVFNSRTCQVVLGAGAMRSAGLKNITAKHLGQSRASFLGPAANESLAALASQALSIMISLIPYIRETLRRHLNPKQAVMLVEFDKLKRDYQEHQNEIHSKLVAIMSDRLQVHCKTLQVSRRTHSRLPSADAVVTVDRLGNCRRWSHVGFAESLHGEPRQGARHPPQSPLSLPLAFHRRVHHATSRRRAKSEIGRGVRERRDKERGGEGENAGGCGVSQGEAERVEGTGEGFSRRRQSIRFIPR